MLRKLDKPIGTPLEPDATLEHWLYSNGMVWGQVFGDKKNRFPDGAWIHTSKVELPLSLEKGELVRTRNSVYLLGEPESEPTRGAN